MTIRAGGVPSGTAARGRRQGRLMPTLALLLGLLCVAVCMLLLFGPMYEEYANPGFLVAGAAYAALAPVLPWWIYVLLMERFTVVALIILLLVLAVLPWGIARFRQRASRSRPSSTAPPAWTSTSSWSSGGSSALSGGISWQVTRTQRSSSVTFGDDDLLVSDDGAGAGEGLMSVQDLKAMAGAAGIPWKSVYETEGGARALLEILRALHAGPSARSSSDSTRCSAAEPRTEDAPATQDAFASSSDPSDPSDPRDPSDASDVGLEQSTSAAEQPAFSAGQPVFAAEQPPFPAAQPSPTAGTRSSADGSMSHDASGSSIWSSGFTASSGSVYTPTSLYDSVRAEHEILGDDDQDQGEEVSR